MVYGYVIDPGSATCNVCGVVVVNHSVCVPVKAALFGKAADSVRAVNPPEQDPAVDDTVAVNIPMPW